MKLTPKKIAAILTLILTVAGALFAPVGEYVDAFKAEVCAPADAGDDSATDAE